MSPSRLTPLVRTAGLAGLAVMAAVTSLSVVVAPVATAAPSCSPKFAEAGLAVDLVDRRSEVPAQKAGARVTAAVRSAVGDELKADQAGELTESDGGLWLDTCGQAFYVDPSSPATGEPARTEGGATQSVDKQLFPLADTFELSSRPGSTRTIYLDFNGHTLSGTAWNGTSGWGSTVALSAYDFEGGASTFTDAERINIQNIWATVAEDYAPFDVDVTTADPGTAALTRDGAADNVYGTRTAITNDVTGQSSCNCGGFAYVGVFNNPNSHAYYQPAIVFTRGVGHGAKTVSEAVSHEVGHNLALIHQGVAGGPGYYGGHGSWAPIMGVSYYKPISQWAHGEYANASSSQDELATITATGLSYASDDHGNNAVGATVLTGPLSVGVDASGVIGSPTDVDTFALTMASSGDLTVAASPAAVGADLDIRLTLTDAGGNVLADVDPVSTSSFGDRADNLGAEVTLTGVAAGTYYVTVDGVGARNMATDGYSDYGSLGHFDLTVSAISSDAPVVTSAAPGEVTVGVDYRHVFSATAVGGGSLTWVLTGALPKGVVFDAATGVLSGRTTVKGAFPVAITVSDTQDRESSRSYVLRSASKLTAGALVARVAAATGSAYTGQLSATGGTEPFRWTATAKPAWASVSTTGVVSGSPTTAGPDTFSLRVTDAAGRTATRDYLVNVTGPLVVRDLGGRLGSTVGGTAVAGLRFSFPLPTYGGKRAYKVTASTAPTGVTVSATGMVSGLLPTPGTYPLSVTVRDALGAQVTKALSLRAVAPLVLEGSAPGATLGRAFTATFTPSGGASPYSVVATTVPAGLTFNPGTGVLSGVPSTLSTSSFATFTVTDSVGRAISRRVQLPVAAPVTATTTMLPRPRPESPTPPG